jgi:hypothetical protein
MNNFPPKTNYEREAQAALEFLISVIGKEKAVYMSAPITSGKRLIEFHKKNGSHLKPKYIYSTKDISIQVAKYNRLHAEDIAKKVRRKINGMVIDPTLVADLNGWTQDDYRFLWGKVIEKYASTVVCIDDWNYSNGCAYEFLIATQSKIETLDENLNSLSLDKGMILIQRAIEDLEQCLLPTNFLQSVIAELSKLNHF